MENDLTTTEQTSFFLDIIDLLLYYDDDMDSEKYESLLKLFTSTMKDLRNRLVQ